MSDNTELLFHGVMTNDHASVIAALEMGADISSVNESGWSVFEQACMHAKVPILRTLLERGAEPNKLGKHGVSGMHLVSKRNHFEKVSILQTFGGDVNCLGGDNVTTPVKLSIQYNNPYIISLCRDDVMINPIHTLQSEGYNHGRWFIMQCIVLAYSADKSVLDVYFDKVDQHKSTIVDIFSLSLLHLAVFSGQLRHVVSMVEQWNIGLDITETMQSATPLQLAIKSGCFDIVKYLLRHNARWGILLSNGDSVIHTAVKNDQKDILEFLLSLSDMKYETIHGQNDDGLSPLDLALELLDMDIARQQLQKRDERDINSVTQNGSHLLHIAVNAGDIRTVTHILDMKADINSIDDDEQTALQSAVVREELPIVRLLLHRSADVSITDYRGRNGQHCAIEAGNREIVMCLLTHNIFLVRQPYLLHCAVSRGNIALISFQMLCRANIFEQDEDGNTVLHTAVQEDHRNCVIFLLEKYPQLQYVPNNDGEYAIHVAAFTGNLQIFKLLLRTYGVPLKLPTEDVCNTVLHKACASGNTHIIRYILSQDPTIIDDRNKYNETSLFAAVKNERRESMLLLLKHLPQVYTIETEHNMSSLHHQCMYNSDVSDIILQDLFEYVMNTK